MFVLPFYNKRMYELQSHVTKTRANKPVGDVVRSLLTTGT